MLSGVAHQMLPIGRGLVSVLKRFLLDEQSIGHTTAIVDQIFEAIYSE